ncbi:fatty-acid amide hydrolase 2-A isoform X2 [Bacillus rossius redtenbacheri]|uniref:fatty-acid amide hydrolase 2-A isoform X2 n=1 Tax=Bacillus rossius redtenbacheri TaxID=93214 RepID=UPI002FDCBA70
MSLAAVAVSSAAGLLALALVLRSMARAYCRLVAGGMLLAKWILLCLLLPAALLRGWRKPRRVPAARSPLLLLSGTALAEMIRTKQAFAARVAEVQPVLNAVVEERFSAALEEARSADRLVQSGQLSPAELARRLPLLGVPVTVKESIAVRGMSNGAGQVREAGQKAAEDAEAVRLLREAGAVPLLVSNTPELCMNLETFNNVTGRTSNPHDSRRTPGGSSGGEAALLSCAASVLSIASDIGGSIRIPAAFTGVFGHKPTPGLISISGHNPTSTDRMWSKMFTIGPMTRYAEDLPLMIRILANENAKLLNLDEPVDFKTLKVYFVEDDAGSIVSDSFSPEIRQALRNVLDHFRTNYNTEIKQMHLPGLSSVVQLTMPLIFIDGIKDAFHDESDPQKKKSVVLELLKFIVGRSELSSSCVLYGVLKSLVDFATPESTKKNIAEENAKLKEHLKELLGTNAVLLYPTFVSSATLHGEILTRIFNAHYALAFNVLEVPATSCPVGCDRKGLPIGIQVVAGPSQDRLCVAVAREIERAFGGWIKPPAVE